MDPFSRVSAGASVQRRAHSLWVMFALAKRKKVVMTSQGTIALIVIIVVVVVVLIVLGVLHLLERRAGVQQ